MNRTILIVICDFLLVSLLAFSTIDINRAANPASSKNLASMNLTLTNSAPAKGASARQDLGDVMRLALEEERKSQDALAAELSKTKSTAGRQQALLNERNAQLQAFQQQLRSREQESAQLMQQQTNLLAQMTAAQNNIEMLNQQLQSNKVETLITQEQRAAQEARAKEQEQRAAALREQLSALERSNQLVTAERAQLAGQLQLTEAQKQAATAQLAMAQQDLNVQRAQNTNLAEGVKVLATKSSELAQEIRDNRPLAPNTIFDQFAANRVNISFFGVRPGFLGGDSSKYKDAQTVLATDGTNTFALCHVHDTLLNLEYPAAWQELTGTVAHDNGVASLSSLSFYLLDPRIILMPVSKDAAKSLDCKIYKLAADPYKFQDAVVIGARGGYYGQCKFQIDLSTPAYLKMDRNSLKGLFGKFNPSTGDLVFSDTGQLLGVMANNTYCAVIQKFETAATFQLGGEVRNQPVADTLASLYTTVAGMPFKLQ
jgi:hypothetical protein